MELKENLGMKIK